MSTTTEEKCLLNKEDVQRLMPASFQSQLAQLLPMEENFLLLFRFDNPLDSSVEFMKVYERARDTYICCTYKRLLCLFMAAVSPVVVVVAAAVIGTLKKVVHALGQSHLL